MIIVVYPKITGPMFRLYSFDLFWDKIAFWIHLLYLLFVKIYQFSMFYNIQSIKMRFLPPENVDTFDPFSDEVQA